MIQSAGVIIYNKTHILGCVPFGRKNMLDIPKGQLKVNEYPDDAVIRETHEETGIKLHQKQLKYLGKFPYTKEKELFIFSTFELFNINKLYCSSTFEFNNKQVPEMIAYKEIEIYDIHSMYMYFYPSLAKIIVPLIKENLWH